MDAHSGIGKDALLPPFEYRRFPYQGRRHLRATANAGKGVGENMEGARSSGNRYDTEVAVRSQ